MTETTTLPPLSGPATPRGSRRGPLVGAGLVLVLGASIVYGVDQHHRATHLPAASASAATVDHAATGRVDAPGFQEEGQPVLVTLRHGAVTMTITGPHVPAQAAAVSIPDSIATFDVSLSGATTDVSLSLSQFVVLDQSAQYVRPAINPGTSGPPAILHAGQTVHFQLRATLPTGEGIVAWSPDGSHVEAKWDFVVEND